MLSAQRVSGLFLTCLIATAVANPAAAAKGKAKAQLIREEIENLAIIERNVMVPMRDGVRLATDIVRPKGQGRHPVILARTPYGKRTPLSLGHVRAGIAMAVQDVRGRYASEGTFDVFRQEINDGYDAVEWLAAQPWCNGKVAMDGGSYLGYTQLAAAMAAPPHLCAISPAVPPADFDRGTMFFGGALRMELAQGWLLGQSWRSQRVQRKQAPQEELDRWSPFRNFRKWCWHNPLRESGPIAIGGPEYADVWSEMVDNWECPTQWEQISAVVRPEAIKVPVFIRGGFYDIFAQENIELLQALRQRGGSELTRQHSHLLIGPWVHGLGKPAGDADFPAARADLYEASTKWMQHWLLDEANGVDQWPIMHFFVMGANRWVNTTTWPPANTAAQRAYLTGKSLSLDPPQGPEPPTEFTYDPANPVPTIGGTNLILPKGVKDHRANAKRPDVAEFITDELDEPYVVAGPIRVHLWVSSSAPDTDFTAMLIDVRPDGYYANIQDGIVRVRYRNGRGAPALVEPGEVVEVDIDLWSTAFVFQPGHRIALHVSSSNFPRFDRHFNVADKPADWIHPQKAVNRIYHDAAHLSYVEAYVVK